MENKIETKFQDNAPQRSKKKSNLFTKIKNNNRLKNILVVILTIICIVLPFGIALYLAFVIRIRCTLNHKIHIKILKSLIHLKRTRKILKSYLRP
jgi:hypothetical protein